MILAIIAAWLAYKKAKATGRNPILWALIAVVTFIGTQFIVSLGLAVGLGADFNRYSIPVTIVAIIASFASTWAVLRYLDKVPETEAFTPPPAPPTDFDQNQ